LDLIFIFYFTNLMNSYILHHFLTFGKEKTSCRRRLLGWNKDRRTSTGGGPHGRMNHRGTRTGPIPHHDKRSWKLTRFECEFVLIKSVRKMLKEQKCGRSLEPPRIPHRRLAVKLAAQIINPRKRHGYILANPPELVKSS